MDIRKNKITVLIVIFFVLNLQRWSVHNSKGKLYQ